MLNVHYSQHCTTMVIDAHPERCVGTSLESRQQVHKCAEVVCCQRPKPRTPEKACFLLQGTQSVPARKRTGMSGLNLSLWRRLQLKLAGLAHLCRSRIWWMLQQRETVYSHLISYGLRELALVDMCALTADTVQLHCRSDIVPIVDCTTLDITEVRSCEEVHKFCSIAPCHPG